MRPGFEPGLADKRQTVVSDDMLSRLDGVLVFPVASTAAIAGLMEQASRRLIAAYLDDDEEALGVELSIEHLATCGAGKRLTTTVELVEHRHQKARLNLAVFDGDRLIATGVHVHHLLPRRVAEAAIAAGAGHPRGQVIQ